MLSDLTFLLSQAKRSVFDNFTRPAYHLKSNTSTEYGFKLSDATTVSDHLYLYDLINTISLFDTIQMNGSAMYSYYFLTFFVEFIIIISYVGLLKLKQGVISYCGGFFVLFK